MADEITTKKVENLSENTEPADTDVYLFGASGTNVIKKIKWSNILTKLRNLLFANNCTTTQAGYGLDARQGKALQDQVNELNTNMTKVKIVEVSGTVSANVDTNIAVDWNLEKGNNLVAYFVERIAGSGNTTNITYCNFSVSTNIRVRSTSTQEVSITAACLYR